MPSQTSYAAFCGGWGIVIAFIGIVALFVESLQGMVIAGLDGLTTFLMVAGGIVSLPELYLNPSHCIYIEMHLCRRENLLINDFFVDLLGNTGCAQLLRL